MLTVQSNVAALKASNYLAQTSRSVETSLARLSSGYRINSAADDAAGLGISENFRAQIAGYNQAIRNSNDGLSVVSTAEGSLGEISDMLVRMRELSVESASDGVTDTERAYVDQEFKQLTSEIDRISSVTEFNGVKLLDGTIGTTATAMDFQVGIRNTADDRLSVIVGKVDSSTLALDSTTVDLLTKDNAQEAIDAMDDAIKSVVTERAKLGALYNRFNSTIDNLGITVENITAANSRIKDVDVAKEMSQFSRQQVLMQAGTSMLAQANQIPQNALSLLRG